MRFEIVGGRRKWDVHSFYGGTPHEWGAADCSHYDLPEALGYLENEGWEIVTVAGRGGQVQAHSQEFTVIVRKTIG